VTLLNSTDGFDIARAPARAPAPARARETDPVGGVRIARTPGARPGWARLRVLIGAEVLTALDLPDRHNRVASSFVAPSPERPGGMLRLSLCDETPLPTLVWGQGRVGVGEVVIGTLPPDMPRTPHPLEFCEWRADAATLWIALPGWVYSGAAAMPATKRFTPEQIDALRRRAAIEGRAILRQELGLTKGQLGYLIDQVPSPGLERKRIGIARHRVRVDYSAPRPVRAEPKERRCMTCGAPFVSEGPHHRLCATHRYGDGLPDQFKGAVL